ncbi:uncharacterized protein LOC117817690 isoform X2 [Notolabrus celidotus]|nr:uncharacterized protein LOC117817690 isoform X2 [Notolabrus celidotus]
MKVINTTLLNVNDHKNHQRSVYVSQRPETQSVQEGASVDLQCSLLHKYKETRVQCPGEHSVYWFRAGFEESHPGVIYTHNNMRFKQGERSCVYSLSKTIQDSSDEGTYYCAVATCGEILFGEGTTVETKKEPNPLYIVLGVLLPYCVFVTAALIISRSRWPLCKQCKGEITANSQAEHPRSAEDRPTYEDGEENSLNYVALDFASRKTQRWTKTRELPEDCTYSGVSTGNV